MIAKTYFFVSLIIISGFVAAGLAFGQTASPTPSPSAVVVPSAPPATGMGGV